MRNSLPILALLAGAAAVAAPVYKWVDANGVTHYSDQPHPGAEEIQLNAAQTYSAPPVSDTPSSAAVTEGPVYKVCEIFRPSAEQVFFSVSKVGAKFRTDPQLRPGDKVTIALDGKLMPNLLPVNGEYVLDPVYRGTHTVVALVEDPEKKQVCQSAPVTFHVRQPSVLAPQSPTGAKPPKKP
jgi:hypothetical protein